MFTRDGYCIREVKVKIVFAKEAFNRRMSLLTSKLKVELGIKLVRCYVWSIALYGSESWTVRKWSRNIWRALKWGAIVE